ncbi:transposase [Streptomyces sp. NBC_01003]|uniref:transposase n=1 Tax=Streptomyces sp. NBC_01003 TaxID=2903714 RepID=UPI003864702B
MALPAGGGGAAGEGLGRSRGGLTCKLHLAADGRCRPLLLVITPGQRADCAQFEAVLEQIRVPRTGSGRPRRTPDSLSADKAYSNRAIRSYLRRRSTRHVIPEKKDPVPRHPHPRARLPLRRGPRHPRQLDRRRRPRTGHRRRSTRHGRRLTPADRALRRARPTGRAGLPGCG